jgi:hypothetical protein
LRTTPPEIVFNPSPKASAKPSETIENRSPMFLIADGAALGLQSMAHPHAEGH